MIQAIRNLFRKRAAVIKRGEHPIKPSDISADARQIIQRLQEAGHTAYIVGGAVRDIMLGFHPKDFDIGTSATPDEIKALFNRRARLIGRRFPIAHIYPPRYKRAKPYEINYIEVTTFRGKSADINSRRYYGKPPDDARRRDFTVNGLFYDPVSEVVYDYVGGMADIEKKRLRMIGNAAKRLQEDPVRILRALRLSVNLGLAIHASLEKHLARCAPLLANDSGERLYNEFIKALNCGSGTRIFASWREFDVCEHALPALKNENPMFFSVMAMNDQRVLERRQNSVSFVVAALFWRAISADWLRLREGGAPPVPAMQDAVAGVNFRENRIIPQRLFAKIKDIYYMQAQMENTPTPRRAHSIISRDIFDRALAFSAMRQEESAAKVSSWWRNFADASKSERELMLQNVPRAKRRSRRRGKKKGDDIQLHQHRE